MQDEKKTRTPGQKKMGRQDARQKTNWETRCEMKKKWGDETRDRKKMGRQDARQKKWGDKTQEKKLGDTRQKKWGTDARKKKGR